MKDRIAALQAALIELDNLLQQAESLSAEDEVAFFKRADDYTRHISDLVKAGALPGDFLHDLLDIQSHLIVRITELKKARSKGV